MYKYSLTDRAIHVHSELPHLWLLPFRLPSTVSHAIDSRYLVSGTKSSDTVLLLAYQVCHQTGSYGNLQLGERPKDYIGLLPATTSDTDVVGPVSSKD